MKTALILLGGFVLSNVLLGAAFVDEPVRPDEMWERPQMPVGPKTKYGPCSDTHEISTLGDGLGDESCGECSSRQREYVGGACANMPSLIGSFLPFDCIESQVTWAIWNEQYTQTFKSAAEVAQCEQGFEDRMMVASFANDACEQVCGGAVEMPIAYVACMSLCLLVNEAEGALAECELGECKQTCVYDGYSPVGIPWAEATACW